MSHLFEQNARKSDVLARYGGEEFIALLPNTDFHEAERTAERLRQTIEDAVMLIDGQSVRLTVSIGVASNVISGEIETWVCCSNRRTRPYTRPRITGGIGSSRSKANKFNEQESHHVH